MKDIDFLPKSYSQRRAGRRKAIRSAAIAGLVCSLLAGVTTLQIIRYSKATAAVAEIESEYQSAVDRVAEFSAVQASMQNDQQEARLFAYLDHPWPRSQLIHRISRHLNESITLSRMQLLTEVPRNQKRFLPEVLTEADLETLSPAQRDLYRLRVENDGGQTVVMLEGFASNASDLHRYVSELGRDALVVRAELDSLRTSNLPHRPAGDSQFRVRLTFCRCYSQPGGPTAPPQVASNELAQHEPPSTVAH